MLIFEQLNHWLASARSPFSRSTIVVTEAGKIGDLTVYTMHDESFGKMWVIIDNGKTVTVVDRSGFSLYMATPPGVPDKELPPAPPSPNKNGTRSF